MTGAGRPGREDQDNLTAIAAAGVGWDYATLPTSNTTDLADFRRFPQLH